MALTNAEKQARWRERHIERRRNAQRIANLLVQKHAHPEKVADLLAGFFNRDGIRTLRRALKPITNAENEARWRKQLEGECVMWLGEHPGMTAKDYRQLRDSDVIEGRKTKAKAHYAAEQQAWERDHPGKIYPEHECGLDGREAADLARWRRQRGVEF